MKFLEIFRFEFAYQVRRPWFWIFLVVLLFLDFLMTRDGAFAEALYSEFFLNSPFAVAKDTVFGGLIWLLMAGAIAGEAAARDVSTGMHPLSYTLPISKAAFLGGKFLAALTLNLLLALSVQAAILLGVYLPGVHPDIIGPFRPEAFITAFGYLALPNVFFATTIQFALALRSGRPMAAYLGSLLLFFIAFFVAGFILFKGGPGALIDTIGVHFIWSDLSHLWTTVEKNYRLLELKGTILHNRLIWIGVGLAVAALTYLSFRFRHRAASAGWWGVIASVFRVPGAGGQVPGAGGRVRGTRFRVASVIRNAVLKAKTSEAETEKAAVRSFGATMFARQAFTIAWSSFRTLASSWAGLILLIFFPLVTVLVVIDQMVSLGAPLIPLTSRVIRELTGALSNEMSRWIVIPGFIIYFAGELVWRERDAGVHEITDTIPGSNWAPLLGKFLGIVFMIVAFTTLQTSAAMAAQMTMNYYNFDIGLYLKVLFGLQLTEYILFTVLALLIHIVVNQKYTGNVVAILVLMFIAMLANMLGIEHNLLIYSASPGWSYTEMRGFGTSLGPWLWFKAYWAAWALLLAVTATLFWTRGAEKRFSLRIRIAGTRLEGPTRWLAVVASLLILTAGAFIFYNTNVLNGYLTRDDIAERSAGYERRYSKYADAPQPTVAAVMCRAEIYPEQRTVHINGSYRLVNNSGVAIDTVHLVTTSTSAIKTNNLTFDQEITLASDDREYNHRIYILDIPLKPGGTLVVDFEVHAEPRGFGNHGTDDLVMKNGTFFSDGLFPSVGYKNEREIINPAIRRKHGLSERPVIASLYETDQAGDTRYPATRGGGIAFEAVVGTSGDQVAIAPGRLKRKWNENGRSYFHYSTSAPIGTEWNFFSANYAMLEEKWADPGSKTVAIQLFHHPEHTGHLKTMVRSIKASLDYYTKSFGPYPYDHLTIVEHPGAPGVGMHASASMVYHGQSVPFWHPRDEDVFDFPYAVVGHEMGHQWSMPYAITEGAPFLAEGLAWYFSMQMVKASRGEGQLKRLLSFMRLPFPYEPIRRGEPLLRALDKYMAYRKGPFAMYAMAEYAGTDRVNGVIRRLIEKSDLPGARPVTTLDLYHELQAVTPDSVKYLLHDLFEVNTYWQFELTGTTAKKIADSTAGNPGGRWQVTLDISARKVAYDVAGTETEMPLDEWVPIGVFGSGKDHFRDLSQPLYLEKHRIRSGDQKITVTVQGEPVLAGVDPFHLLDWEEKEDDDNIESVRRGKR